MLNRFLKSPFFKIILVLLLGIILTAIATWPFVINIPYFYSDFGDYPLAGASFWYNQNAIVTGKILNQLEYLKGFEFYPQPYVAAYADFKLIASLIFSLF
ncbi:hypothetical protein KKG52_03855, partial [Patescibacteria group bacterium]|nr:hypothetical protein [Patescibacteria group bacterium]